MNDDIEIKITSGPLDLEQRRRSLIATPLVKKLLALCAPPEEDYEPEPEIKLVIAGSYREFHSLCDEWGVGECKYMKYLFFPAAICTCSIPPPYQIIFYGTWHLKGDDELTRILAFVNGFAVPKQEAEAFGWLRCMASMGIQGIEVKSKIENDYYDEEWTARVRAFLEREKHVR